MSLLTTWNRVRYGLYAPVYDLIGRRMDGARRRSIGGLYLQAGERVLIVGAGTGLDLPYLPDGVHVTAVDLSESMLRRAVDRARGLPLDVTCRVMDAGDLDLPDESFDAALLHLVLAVVPDPMATITEVARVLRPGGRAGIFDKFLPEGIEPSLGRRIVGVAVDIMFSDINRSLEPILDHGGLVLEHDEASYGGGLYRIAQARKPEVRDVS